MLVLLQFRQKQWLVLQKGRALYVPIFSWRWIIMEFLKYGQYIHSGQDISLCVDNLEGEYPLLAFAIIL